MDGEAAAYFEAHGLGRFLPRNLGGELSLERFEPGATIVELGMPVDSLRFFVEGRARVVLPEENGRRLLLCFYEPLQLFGDAEILEAGLAASASIEAMGPCACLRLSRRIVEARLAGDPAFLGLLCRSLGRKLARVLRNGALNQLYPLEARAASYIMAAAYELRGGSLLFSATISHVAELLGTGYRQLQRCLVALCEEGLLEKTRGGYLVRRPEELQRRAGSSYVLPGALGSAD